MKLLLKILIVIGVLLLGLLLYVTFSHQPEAFPEGSASAARLRPGPFSVASLDERFVDRSRPTQANGSYPGINQRELVGRVWYPLEAEAGASPLLIFSHGFTSMYRNGAYLAEHLASHGFVVVAVNYPLTHMSAPGGPLVGDVVRQPGDVSFLIDTLIGRSAVAGNALTGKIDDQRIGVFGVSLGGLTSTLAAYHPRWRDPRIGAALSIAGPSNFFTADFFATADVPFMMLAGEQDVLVPFESNAAPIPAKLPGAELVTIAGGSHTGFSGGTAWLRMMDNTDALGCYSVKRAIKEGSQDSWVGLMGSEDEGIDYGVEDQLCKVDPLPRAMNVLRQQMIARVVVTAFFERHLVADAARRREAAGFLTGVIGRELPEVSYRRSQPRVPAPRTGDDEEQDLSDGERAILNALMD